jgi:hypothetical protein
MVEKLFIVAADNDAVYRSLQRGLAGEENVAMIMYDRRRARSVARCPERRRRTDVAAQLQTRGWAVVHLYASPPSQAARGGDGEAPEAP